MSEMTALAIGTIILSIVAVSVDSFTRVSVATTDRAANVTAASGILERAMVRLDASQPLGACVADEKISATPPSINGGPATPTYSFATAFQNCDQVTTVGTPFWGAASNGICYYGYPQLAPNHMGQMPPNLYCLYIAAPSDILYLAEWKAQSGSTYTTCSPATCFGSTSSSSFLPVQGSVPSTDPAGCSLSCPSNWFDLGKELNVVNAFSYTSGGSAWSPGTNIPINLAVTLTMHAENDYQKYWLGPQIYDLNFTSTPTGGDGATSQTWYSLSG